MTHSLENDVVNDTLDNSMDNHASNSVAHNKSPNVVSTRRYPLLLIYQNFCWFKFLICFYNTKQNKNINF